MGNIFIDNKIQWYENFFFTGTRSQMIVSALQSMSMSNGVQNLRYYILR